MSVSIPPPGVRPDCDPEFPSPPTPKRYYLRNKKRPFTNFIRAEITALNYLLYDVQNDPADGRGCPGGWLFEMAWTHFARNHVSISGIRGAWTYGTNLATINQLTQNKQQSLADAAKQTWAFAQASKKGFSKIQVLDSDGAPGSYLSVDVVFLP